MNAFLERRNAIVMGHFCEAVPTFGMTGEIGTVFFLIGCLTWIGVGMVLPERKPPNCLRQQSLFYAL
ncbi:hypothetical protein IMZ31_22040 (plasmid) [Pontibacillus sp. ALD_SL1]|uniref:hypothetical protein n=1 Tax=Pontibacillus sp. ALD_SL1 TaxID=2777185 RepID=UPI001A96F72B|nr:hypothetical protein [Pontibacillus sp. ALD_SL1]QST02135.1 hypothetical protein IMZ31_22040 [Pontibacillus sp. ALD_SL1]